jgi:hypothetical protein
MGRPSPYAPSLRRTVSRRKVAPPPRHKPIKAITVEEGLRAVSQAHARLGAPDPLKDSHGGIDFRIQQQIKAYKKYDAPPKRVKPVPILIIIFIAGQAFGDTRLDEEMVTFIFSNH